MNNLLMSPKWRFGIALGASMGISHVLFRALTTNLGPILGMITGVIAIALITLGFFLILGATPKRVEN